MDKRLRWIMFCDVSCYSGTKRNTNTAILILTRETMSLSESFLLFSYCFLPFFSKNYSHSWWKVSIAWALISIPYRYTFHVLNSLSFSISFISNCLMLLFLRNFTNTKNCSKTRKVVANNNNSIIWSFKTFGRHCSCNLNWKREKITNLINFEKALKIRESRFSLRKENV